MKGHGLGDLVHEKKVQDAVLKELQAAGKQGGLAGIEVVDGVVLADEEWTPQNVCVLENLVLNTTDMSRDILPLRKRSSGGRSSIHTTSRWTRPTLGSGDKWILYDVMMCSMGLRISWILELLAWSSFALLSLLLYSKILSTASDRRFAIVMRLLGS